jgi:hypothetical protein
MRPALWELMAKKDAMDPSPPPLERLAIIGVSRCQYSEKRTMSHHRDSASVTALPHSDPGNQLSLRMVS